VLDRQKTEAYAKKEDDLEATGKGGLKELRDIKILRN
jgi:hypothetical protein